MRSWATSASIKAAPIGFLTFAGPGLRSRSFIANVWIGVPFFTVLLYSALQDVPIELQEAAMLDGANSWQRLYKVTLPVIRPIIEVVFVLRVPVSRSRSSTW